MRKTRGKDKRAKGTDIILRVDNGGWARYRNSGKEVMQDPALVRRSMRSEHIPNMFGFAVEIHFQGSGKTKPGERVGRRKKGTKNCK